MADDDSSEPEGEDEDEAPPAPVGAAGTPPNLATPGFQPKAVQVGGDSLVDRIIPHIKQILVATIVVALVLGAYFGKRWWDTRKEAAATDKTGAVLDVAARGIQPTGSDTPPVDKPVVPTFNSAADRANGVLTAIAQQGTDVDPLMHASMLVQAGKLDEAIALYQAHQGDADVDGVLAREGLGLALEAKASAEKDAAAHQRGNEAALAAFQSMQPDANGPRYAYALYHQGRLLYLLNKRADSRAMLAKAKTAAATSSPSLGKLIDVYLATLGSA